MGALCEDEDDHGDFAGNFYRARVTLDVRKPLKNQVSIVKKQKGQIFKVKYERLPDWCDICGMIGHLYTEHGDGVHDPKALIFKELRVAWSMGEEIEEGVEPRRRVRTPQKQCLKLLLWI